MKKGKLLFLIAILFSIVSVQAQDQAEMMKKWQEYMTPGPMHAELAKMAGNWKAEITQYAGGQEMKAEGTAVFEMILGGRYLKSSFKTEFMGMPMEGFGLDAYDNQSKEFVSVWLDNFGTGVLVLKGSYDPAAKTITYIGNTFDPMSGKEIKMKNVNHIVDENKTVNDMYNIVDGKEVKSMSITYTRVK